MQFGAAVSSGNASLRFSRLDSHTPESLAGYIDTAYADAAAPLFLLLWDYLPKILTDKVGSVVM